MNDLRSLDAMVTRCDRLTSFADAVAVSAAPRVDAILRGNIARGVSPDGTPWPKTADGHAPLTHAGKSLRVFARGPDVVVELYGVPAMHDTGRVRGGVRRQIVPDGISPAIARVVDEVAREEWARVMSGAT